MQAEVKQCTEQFTYLNLEVTGLKHNLKQSRKELNIAQRALRDISNEMLVLKQQRDKAEQKLHISKYRRSGNFRVKNISCVKISWR